MPLRRNFGPGVRRLVTTFAWSGVAQSVTSGMISSSKRSSWPPGELCAPCRAVQRRCSVPICYPSISSRKGNEKEDLPLLPGMARNLRRST